MGLKGSVVEKLTRTHKGEGVNMTNLHHPGATHKIYVGRNPAPVEELKMVRRAFVIAS